MDSVPEEVWANILSFVPTNLLTLIANACSEFNSMIFSTERVCCKQLWRLNCIQQLKDELTLDETSLDMEPLLDFSKLSLDEVPLNSYLDLYKSRMMRFDTSTVNEKLTKLVFSNRNRTVENMRQFNTGHDADKWEALRLHRKLLPGRKYTLKFRLDNHQYNVNTWNICIGINDLQMNYRRMDDTFGCYGCCSSYGITLVAYDGVLYNSKTFTTPTLSYNDEFLNKKPLLNSGDILTMVVDMTNASEESDKTIKQIEQTNNYNLADLKYREVLQFIGTSVEYFINDKPLMKHPFYGVAGQEFYVTVNLINQQKVSVLSGSTLYSDSGNVAASSPTKLGKIVTSMKKKKKSGCRTS
jgi:hypothetical protein